MYLRLLKILGAGNDCVEMVHNESSHFIFNRPFGIENWTWTQSYVFVVGKIYIMHQFYFIVRAFKWKLKISTYVNELDEQRSTISRVWLRRKRCSWPLRSDLLRRFGINGRFLLCVRSFYSSTSRERVAHFSISRWQSQNIVQEYQLYFISGNWLKIWNVKAFCFDS